MEQSVASSFGSQQSGASSFARGLRFEEVRGMT